MGIKLKNFDIFEELNAVITTNEENFSIYLVVFKFSVLLKRFLICNKETQAGIC